jgi:glycosyltransferase involved in cell wall biosynthesis
MELSSNLSESPPGFAPASEPISAGEMPIQREPLVKHIALIGNHLPRRCGIATYTSDVFLAMKKRFPSVKVDVWAMNDGKIYAYPENVTGEIEQSDLESYRTAARAITASGAEMVWIQHEFGIFGGKAGDHILTLIDRMTVPVTVAMHTVLEAPNRDQRRVTLALVDRCETIIVMAEGARRILVERFGADPAQIVVIPHGIPDRPFMPTAPMKEKLGFSGRKLILTFGLLSPGKGIETMIAALPEIASRHPDVLYLVLGATHPHCVDWKGEAYRESLQALAEDLGVAENIQFIDEFVEIEDLLDYLAAADVYATPYLNAGQVTSGTLAYAVGLGKPIVSTPYIHARELLAHDHGRLVEFGDYKGFAEAISDLLDDDAALNSLRKKTYALGRTMIWPRLAESSMARFEEIARRAAKHPSPLRQPDLPRHLPDDAIERMSDATGMLQHSILGVPNRAHGYCVDDNARAFMLMCRQGTKAHPKYLPVYASFVENAWNPDKQRFRNFMAFDRSWLENIGSEDSCGRTVWSLGIAASQGVDPDIRDWARKLFNDVAEPLCDLGSPRAKAFMMLGAAAIIGSDIAGSDSDDSLPQQMIARLGDALNGLFGEYHKPGWDWFEPVLAYDNARLSEALIRGGLAIGRTDFVRRGIRSLDWLMKQQTNEDGHFRAIGSDSFGRIYAPPLPFDQQPIEAWAAVDACDAAFGASGEKRWQRAAVNAYRWFLGKNELGVAVGDAETGECYDGLIPTGVNRNRGAESILAFHHATITIQRHRGG